MQLPLFRRGATRRRSSTSTRLRAAATVLLTATVFFGLPAAQASAAPDLIWIEAIQTDTFMVVDGQWCIRRSAEVPATGRIAGGTGPFSLMFPEMRCGNTTLVQAVEIMVNCDTGVCQAQPDIKILTLLYRQGALLGRVDNGKLNVTNNVAFTMGNSGVINGVIAVEG